MLARLQERLSVSRGAGWALASQVITSGANFVATLIVVRALGLQDFGRFSVCFILIMIVRNFLNGTVLTPMAIIGPKLSRTSTPAYRGFLLVNVMVFAAGSSFLLVAIAMPLGVLLNAPWLPSMAIPLATANCLCHCADYVRRYHFVYHAPALAFGVDALRYIVQLGLLLLLSTVLPGHFSPATALLAIGVGGLAGTILGMASYGNTRWKSRLSTVVWPRHLNFIHWMTPSVSLETAQGMVPLLIGEAVLCEKALGLLRAMQSLANVLNLPSNALQQVAPTMAASAYVAHGLRALRRFLFRMTAWSLGAVMLASSLVLAFSDAIIGKAFSLDTASARPILLLYCVLNIIMILRLPLSVGVQAVERPEISAAANVFGLAATCALAPLAIGISGAAGVPIVNIVAAVITAAICLVGMASHARGARPATKHARAVEPHAGGARLDDTC